MKTKRFNELMKEIQRVDSSSIYNLSLLRKKTASLLEGIPERRKTIENIAARFNTAKNFDLLYVITKLYLETEGTKRKGFDAILESIELHLKQVDAYKQLFYTLLTEEQTSCSK